MKVRKYDEENTDVLRLELRDAGLGIKLVAVDENGDKFPSGAILEITEDGELCRFSDVNDELPLELERHGTIRIGDAMWR